MIRGVAGTGKTVLMLLKIIQLIKFSGTSKKILLLAPYPHHLRCCRLLKSNDIPVICFDKVENLEKTVAEEPSTATVIIMEYREFFTNAETVQKMSNVVQNMHIFIDDIHSLITDQLQRYSNSAQHYEDEKFCLYYEDVAAFITSLISQQGPDEAMAPDGIQQGPPAALYRWINIDLTQDQFWNFGVEMTKSLSPLRLGKKRMSLSDQTCSNSYH